MATRGRTSFLKKQKEMARRERQQEKAERRERRKMMRATEERTPPQDPASEGPVGDDGFGHRGQSGGRRPLLQERSN